MASSEPELRELWRLSGKDPADYDRLVKRPAERDAAVIFLCALAIVFAPIIARAWGVVP